MMKINSKFWIGGLVFAISMGLLLPSVAYAELGVSPNGKGVGGGNFCAKIINNKLDQQIATKISRLQSNYQDRQTKVTQKRAEQTTNLSTKQTKWDTNREQHFARLEAKAETDAQKTAVTKFVAAVNAAVRIRRAAVAAAVQVFRTGVDQAILARRSALITVLDGYYKAVKAALDKAKTDCAASDADDTAIRTAFKNSLKSAQAKMQSEKTKVDKLGETVQSLSDTKKAAMTKAVNDFKAAVEAARVELEKAFPVSS